VQFGIATSIGNDAAAVMLMAGLMVLVCFELVLVLVLVDLCVDFRVVVGVGVKAGICVVEVMDATPRSAMVARFLAPSR